MTLRLLVATWVLIGCAIAPMPGCRPADSDAYPKRYANLWDGDFEATCPTKTKRKLVWGAAGPGGVLDHGLPQRVGQPCHFSLSIPDETTLSIRVSATVANGPAQGRASFRITTRVDGEARLVHQGEVPPNEIVTIDDLPLPAGGEGLELEAMSADRRARTRTILVWSRLALATLGEPPESQRAGWRVPVDTAAASWLESAVWPAAREGAPRMLVIGIDGASWRYVDELIESGEMPNLAALKARGRFGPLESTIVPESAMSWTSIRTGVGAGKHGVLHFASLDRRRASYWSWLQREGVTPVVLGVPKSNPSEYFEGVLVGGWNLRESDQYARPEGLDRALRTSTYRPQISVVRNPNIFLERMRARTDLALELMRGIGWEHAFVVYEYSDTAAHVFGLGDPAWRYSYRLVDEEIGRLLGEVDDETTILVISDHGWKRFRGSFAPRAFLAAEGFEAWAPWLYGGSRFVLRLRSELAPDEEARQIEALRGALAALRVPGTERPLVEQVIPTSEALPGPESQRNGMRLLVVLTPDYHAKSLSDREQVIVDEPAEHHDTTGLYLLAGPGVPVGEGPRASVLDVAPTAARVHGVEPPKPLDGRPIWPTEAPIGRAKHAPTPSGPDPENEVPAEPEREMSEEMKESLRALGYIEE